MPVCFFKVAAPFYILTSNVRGFQFLYILVNICHFLSFLNSGHSSWCKVVSHCGFDLHFPNDFWCWASFHVLVGHRYIFFEECLLSPLSIFDLVCLSFCCWVLGFLYIFWILIPYEICDLQIFSLILWVAFLLSW